ncbi:MAG: non-heme iron oxygenase ferredoxin subunit [Chloroflexi bacterium]|nr:non-heme iron oxygenase ferredoxin subunit [Chloroflexota bacterium]
MAKLVNAGKVSDVKPGQMKLVEVGEERILLANVGGKFYAVSEVCTHVGGPLSEGTLEGEEVECPWHGSRFNVTTGEVVDKPAKKNLQRYATKVQGQDVLIEVP